MQIAQNFWNYCKLRGKTFALALFGVAAFWLLNLPLPFLFGPMFFCLFASLAGMKLKGFGQISEGSRTILGLAVGTSITPAVVYQIGSMGYSLALIPLFILIIGFVGVPYFLMICKFDRPTAYYCAMPGGMQDMVLFGEEAGGNPRTLSLVHATRVLIVVTLAPIILTSIYSAQLDNPIGLPATESPVHELIIMIVIAFIGWKGGKRIKLFGAAILGPLILAAILSLTDILHGRPPKEAILFAQFFIGIGIGVHFVGVTWSELRKIVVSGIGYVFILAILAAIFTEIAVKLGGYEQLNSFLAFAPGGQAEMTVLAIVAGADLGFVVAHHLFRIVIVILFAPIVAIAMKKWLAKSENGAD